MNWNFHLLSAAILMLNTSFASANKVDYYVIAEQARPFQIETKGADHSGIVTDIVKEVFKGSEHQLNYHTYPFNRMISILSSQDQGNWITYGSPNWGKVQSENLSEEPIYTVRHNLLFSSKKPIDYNQVSDLKGKIVVLLMGFDFPELQPYFASGEMQEMRVKNYQSAFRVVDRHPGDMVFVEMDSRIIYNQNQLNLDKKLYSQQDFNDVIPDYSVYLALSPTMDKEVQDYINKRLKVLKKQGKIDEIIKQYI
ncbi:ABC transporter substrate-binding protein [Vibrio pectenicida]|uniref:ABC transporter substrate-binding protein n=1 Tax=Vibrio pectenicida TaxID=62763 RepID=A0A7Y3ZXY3_9VIBR|nr:ABC transporter substrate-binding protein [Vibrio pectenicida]NOH71162.1 ABC transporter substrate-binding protein [Vibrio pectenicida]